MLVVVLAAAMAAWLVHDMFFRVQPDVQIGYVGTTVLPAETVQALEQALTPYASDSNGDGQVIVQLDQYAVDFANENADPAGQLAGTTQLTAALAESSGTYLFLLEDPAGFESQIQALQFTDGTLPGRRTPAAGSRWSTAGRTARCWRGWTWARYLPGRAASPARSCWRGSIWAAVAAGRRRYPTPTPGMPHCGRR